jgi:soluble lytic murein transglycosylase
MVNRRWLIIAAFLLGAGLWAWRWFSGWRLEHSQDDHILAAGRRYAVDPSLVKAVVWQESRFDPRARGKAGELGLMQLMDAASQEWAETVRAYPLPPRHLLDPGTNTLAGTWYLRKLLLRYRQTDNPVPYALADYNAGRANVLKWNQGAAATNSARFVNQIEFPGTRAYVLAVMERRERYRPDFPPAPRSGRR